ncbi:hypothetical protein JD276_04470 [Leucobacter sp. CSA1]|uniref:DUF4355 domain-containing protein n=1 Tax=Leucobacter chromiisoli TaxID=2796471 RepID=A0A934Q6I2_9MICO|nr:hypothetical protein [Leucobacter chromiisoli]MBK0418285.1 hypothetical protein [Leucobacter chromiisoli]
MSEQVETQEPAVEAAEPAELGDAGKKAIAAERDARKQAEAAAAEYKKKLDAIEQASLSELEKAQRAAESAAEESARLKAEIESRDLQILKQSIGAELKLPPELVARLQGDTEEALREDAKSLAALVPDTTSPFPKADPSQGVQGSAAGGTNADRFASFLDKKLN